MIARNLTCRSIAFIPCGRVESNIMLSPSFSTNSFSPIRRCMLPSRTRLNSCPGWVLSVNGASGADGSTVTMKGSALRLANPAANRLIFIGFCTLYGDTFVFSGKEIRVHSGFVSEPQCRQFYAVVLGYLVQKTDRNVFFARLSNLNRFPNSMLQVDAISSGRRSKASLRPTSRSAICRISSLMIANI